MIKRSLYYLLYLKSLTSSEISDDYKNDIDKLRADLHKTLKDNEANIKNEMDNYTVLYEQIMNDESFRP